MVSMGRAMDRQGPALRRPDLKLFIKDVRDRQQRKRAITIRSWSTIQEVKNVIQKMMHVPPSAQRLYFGPLLSSGGELPNHRTLHDAGIYRSGETLLLDIKISNSISPDGTLSSSAGNDICISSSMIDSTPKVLRSIVQKARRGFQVGLKPSLFLDGSGGSYAVFDPRKKKIAVFKPADEEVSELERGLPSLCALLCEEHGLN
jgi:Ubiquitin family